MEIKSDKIVHTYDYICCNICQEQEIYKDNLSGVCNMCADNRVKDKIWTKEQRFSQNLRTNIYGDIKTK